MGFETQQYSALRGGWKVIEMIDYGLSSFDYTALKYSLKSFQTSCHVTTLFPVTNVSVS